MSSIIQLLRRIGGTKTAPTSGSEGQLAIWKAGKAPTDPVALFWHDGAQWVELLDTAGRKVTQHVTSSETPPAAPPVGDMWFKPSSKALSSWDGAQWSNVAFTNVSNNFTVPQSIEVTHATLPGLRVTQKGAGPAFVVEDDAHPDTTPFIVDTDGKVGVGTTSALTHALNVNGGIKTQGWGGVATNGQITFGSDEKAAVAGNATMLTFVTESTAHVCINKTGLGIGLGASAPSQALDVNGGAKFQGWGGVATQGNIMLGSGGPATIYGDPSVMIFSSAGKEVMRFNNNQEVGVGGLAEPGERMRVHGNLSAIRYVGRNNTNYGHPWNIYWTGSAPELYIDNVLVGNLSIASDYRVKKDVEDNTGEGLERIKRLRPVTYKFTDYGEIFKGDGVHREGFIAHELAEIIPSAVAGRKDDPEQIQSLRLDALCSVMVKAIQELSAKVEALEART